MYDKDYELVKPYNYSCNSLPMSMIMIMIMITINYYLTNITMILIYLLVVPLVINQHGQPVGRTPRTEIQLIACQ